MEQIQNREMPGAIHLTIDFGSTTTKVGISDPAEDVDYLLEFPSSANQVVKHTTELDTTLVFTENPPKFTFGADGLSYAKGLVFRHWKLGAMGVEPYAGRLIQSCRRLQQKLGHFTPASLFRILFDHILKTAKEHLRKKHGESFGPIKTWLTYPVSCGESIRVLLLQEAMAAGLDVMGSGSESLMAACFLETKKTNLLLPDGARLILDFGGATVDATVLYKNDDSQWVQACATDGCPKGGQMVNELCRRWLQKKFKKWKALWNDDQWALFISPSFDACKRAFDGQSAHVLYRGDSFVEIPPAAMKEFFRPLMFGAVMLARRMRYRARKAGHPVKVAVACGGITTNTWFKSELFKLLKEEGIPVCEKIEDHGIVALGALQYARSPVEEELRITRDLGLGYDGDYDENGEPLKKGEWQRGIGWILRKGQDPKMCPDHLIFTKKIQPGSKDAGDHIIESEMHVTPPDSGEFSEKHIKRNNLIEWDCDITYPATEEIFSYLSHLGTFSGKIPHEKLFPLGTEKEEREFKFRLTLENDRHLLRGGMAVELPGELCPLPDVYYTPLPLVPRSEYLNQQGQLRRHGKRRAGAANVCDGPATRHPNLRSSTEPSRSSGSPDSGSPDSGSPDSGSPNSGSPNSGSPDSGSLDSGSPRHPPYLPDDLPSVRGRSRPDHTASSSLQHRNAPPGGRYPIRYIPPPSEDEINRIINDLPRLAGHRGTHLSV